MELTKSILAWVFWLTVFSPVFVFIGCVFLFIFTGAWNLEHLTEAQWIVGCLWVAVWAVIGCNI